MGILRPRYVHPTRSEPRTALLDSAFRPARNTATFDGPDDRRLSSWRPECIAGALAQVEACAFEPSHAIVVFTRPGQCLTGADRDRLWERFGVPVFEQIVEDHGGLLATECEAHDGLHLVCGLDAAPPGALRRGLCACGAEAVRIFPVREPDQRTFTVTRAESVWPAAPVATT